MKNARHAITAGLLLAGGTAFGQEENAAQGLKITGSVEAGAISSSFDSNNRWKATEYRDLESGFLGNATIRGRAPDYYFDGSAENIGRDDQGIDLRGGRYNSFRWQVYDSRMVHNWTYGALTPFAGAGGPALTATLPSLNIDTWNRFDFSKKREDLGGMFEAWFGTPWFVRVDANEVTQKGIQLIAGSNGNSPGNGFTDLPFPVDYKTRNAMIEAGYTSRRGQLSLSVLQSKFGNDNEQLRWTNAFFGSGLDTTYLAPDNTYTRIGLNGVLKQLPAGSTLSGRLTSAKTTSNFNIATSALNTGGAISPTNPSSASFDGNVAHKAASLSLHSNWTRALDTRFYWNELKKENTSTEVTFATAAVAGLACGGANCVTELLHYKKKNYGAEAGYRFNAANRLIAGFDYLDLERNRVDFDSTEDKRASLEYRNTSLDWLGARLKYQYMERRSNFLEGNSGVNGADPLYLDRFIARFDASNVDQNLIKAAFDIAPAPLWDAGIELIFKENKYKDTVLGRKSDDRQQLYASIGHGDIKSFRVMAFFDVEYVQYDSTHRNISQLTPAGGVTAIAIYDPNSPAQCNGASCNYNWNSAERDRNHAFGIGADWLPLTRLKLSASAMYQVSHGTADFAVQPTPAAINPPAAPISNLDNTRRVTFNLKGTYNVLRPLDVTLGYAHEKYTFSDIGYDGYRYTIGTGTGASYLSGAYANPNYKMDLIYLTATYRFE